MPTIKLSQVFNRPIKVVRKTRKRFYMLKMVYHMNTGNYSKGWLAFHNYRVL